MEYGVIGVGAALALAAIGSAIGTKSAGMSAVGAWKKAFAQNKPAPFLLVAFVGAPLTQTIYGFILMNSLNTSDAEPMRILAVGILGGAAMAFSAAFQGRAGAVASDALTETGKGFGQYIMVLGIIETVALFVMVFLLGIV
ncbi:MAG: V-type ATP synthase subunit K [Spirochaetota bacterium]